MKKLLYIFVLFATADVTSTSECNADACCCPAERSVGHAERNGNIVKMTYKPDSKANCGIKTGASTLDFNCNINSFSPTTCDTVDFTATKRGSTIVVTKERVCEYAFYCESGEPCENSDTWDGEYVTTPKTLKHLLLPDWPYTASAPPPVCNASLCCCPDPQFDLTVSEDLTIKYNSEPGAKCFRFTVSERCIASSDSLCTTNTFFSPFSVTKYSNGNLEVNWLDNEDQCKATLKCTGSECMTGWAGKYQVGASKVSAVVSYSIIVATVALKVMIVGR
eukprot:m.1187 g.1187  ORF g.1187 m.1187 type:complete len:278 (+) comp5847_c0_seq1:74-907(+)